MTETQKDALANLKAASADKPPRAYCQFAAGDVAAVAGLVKDVPAGPVEILVKSVAGLKPSTECHASAAAVRDLVALVEGKV